MSKSKGNLVGCCCATTLLLGLAVLLYPVFAPVAHGQHRTCIANVKILALSQIMYAADNNDRFPPCEQWMDTIWPYVRDESRYHCTAFKSEITSPCGYAMNIEVSGVATATINKPSLKPLLFDSIILGRNACSNLVGLPDPPRHNGNYVGYADGHASKGPSLNAHP